jgi:hypothetical protein
MLHYAAYKNGMMCCSPARKVKIRQALARSAFILKRRKGRGRAHSGNGLAGFRQWSAEERTYVYHPCINRMLPSGFSDWAGDKIHVFGTNVYILWPPVEFFRSSSALVGEPRCFAANIAEE